MKLLLHTCCAPCSVTCIDMLRQEGIEPTLYFYNPNIHPYMEYKARRDCLKKFAKTVNVELIVENSYGLTEFCRQTVDKLDTRCEDYCYPTRIGQTVRYAANNGYDAFSTTLLVSPFQKHDKLKMVCEDFSKLGVEFLYRDFRVGFKDGQQKALELGLYRQKYCGCIVSEEERFATRIKHDKAWTRDN